MATGLANAEPHQARIVTATATATATPIKDSYIVTVDRSARGLTAAATAAGVTPTHVYDSAFTGFAAKLTPGQLRKLSRDPSVTLIEQDMLVTDALDATQTNPPSWGIDRIDQRNLPLSNSYTWNVNGSGVHAYIIDTGITPATRTSAGGPRSTTTPSTATTPTARATARTWRAPSARTPTAWPRASGCTA
ncbi:S8 family serine peptidase [Actinosynnema sp. CA-248983]